MSLTRCYVYYINNEPWKIYGDFPTWNQKKIAEMNYRRENNIPAEETLKCIVKMELR